MNSSSLAEERKLDLDEKPLVVQLNWNKDDREGRFVLKNENDIIPKVSDGARRRSVDIPSQELQITGFSEDASVSIVTP